MKAALGAFLGLVVGLPIGAALGVAAGFAWTSVTKTSDFEGYGGMLVFYAFMPIGAILGGLIGAVLLAHIALRS